MRRFISLAAIAAALGVSGAASAQDPQTRDYTPVNFAFRIGGAIPIDDRLSDVGDFLFAAGIDYRIDKPFFAGGETFFSVDWFGKSGTTGDKGNVFPVNINHKWFTNTATDGGNRTYFFVGVGAQFIDVSRSDTVIGARAGLGMELGPYFFAEGTLYVSDKAQGNVRGTAGAFYLGYRF